MNDKLAHLLDNIFAFHITAAMIHILLVIALVLIVLHFLRGRRI